MKKQIITLVIGILIGAVITGGVFLLVNPRRGGNMPNFSQMDKSQFKDGEFDPSTMRDKFKDRNSNNDSSKTEKPTEDTANEKQG